MDEILKISNLCKSFSKKKVLKNISLSVERGKIIGILAPNAAGKTTLLKTICNLYKADSGEIIINGKKVGYETKKCVSFMPDSNHLFKWMKVKDCISYYNDMFPDFSIEKSNFLCDSLEIDKTHTVKTLSKGMIERVILMLTLSRNAEIYLLDEPLGGIDIVTKDKILKTILNSFEDNETFIISTHLVKEIETILDDVIFINNGEIVFSGSAEDIRLKKGKSVENYYLEVLGNV